MSFAITTLLIGTFGSLGALARYIISELVMDIKRTNLPWAILGINVLGSALFLVATYSSLGNLWISAITTGFCGGFTTFSTVISTSFLIPEISINNRITFLFANIICSIGVIALLGIMI
ncbi:MAG: CrcB family protein [Micrococcaceae bacterium]